MSELLKLDLTITDDMSMTQEMDAIKLLSRAAQVIGASAILRRVHTINSPVMQALLNGAAQVEIAGDNWNQTGSQAIQIPRMVPPPPPGTRPH